MSDARIIIQLKCVDTLKVEDIRFVKKYVCILLQNADELDQVDIISIKERI